MPKARENIKGLGAKYGGTLRKRYARVFRTLKASRECPSCSSRRLARTSSGIWKCKSCGYTVAGGAFDLAQTKSR
ncbi:MAG: transposase [Nitrososphaerota archaeon]|nr:transposase [Nitrososphaerota archaeon]MDG6990425.1 transposase [Nitrososphaerota archaeon]